LFIHVLSFILHSTLGLELSLDLAYHSLASIQAIPI